jgi:hypothetical protein
LSSLNEGQVDYAWVPLTKPNTPQGETTSQVASDHTNLLGKYIYGTSNTIPIEKDGWFSVLLRQAFIKKFTERWERFHSALGFGRARGEIAVLAQVYELGSGPTPARTIQEAKKSSRLIYYSDDVRWGGQFLNLSDIPIYGPTKFNGNRLYVQLRILELDTAESAQFRSVLKTLAAIGKAAYAPAAPGLAIAEQLGDALLKGEQDDSEFKYDMTIAPTAESNPEPGGSLAAGYYVFIKEDAVNSVPPYVGTGFDLRNLKLDRIRGRLVKNGTDYTDQTHLILQIKPEDPDTQQDISQTLDAFQSSQLAQIEANTLQPEEFGKRVETFVRRKKEENRSTKLLNDFRRLTDKKGTAAREMLLELHGLLQKNVRETDLQKRGLTDSFIDELLAKLRRGASAPDALVRTNLASLNIAAFLKAITG